jgi:hypothetical protein
VIRTTVYHWGAALLLCICALLLSLAPSSLQAQAVGSSLTGTITDAKGGALQDATVNVKNENTNDIRTIKVDAQGHSR